MTHATCPAVRHWQALLEDGEASSEPAELIHHLETCAGCQQTLEVLTADQAVWDSIARGLGETVRQEPALRHLVERLKSEEPLPVAEEDCFFLRPTDQPGLLGLLGQYEVQEEIGRGGMGVVFKALDPALSRVVAIKVLSPFLASSATARRRFVRESRAAAAVCHDHIVAVHGVHEENGLPYLVMQYIPGESLQARLDRTGPLEVVEIVRIGYQTAAGLAAAHAQGLIHRDIKPANLLLENGLARVKITDFGLARMADDVQLTQNGTVTGTPEYMAPEQARGEPVDHRADLFSLGSVLHALCTGRPPFRGSTAVAVLRQVSDQVPPPVRSLNPEVPAWLEALVARLLAKDPADRCQSAAEVAALLEGYLAHLHQPAKVFAPVLPPLRGRAPAGQSSQGFLTGVLGGFSPLVCLSALVLLAVLGLGMGFWFLEGNVPAQQAREAGKVEPGRQHVAFDFRADIDNFPALVLSGPDAETVARTDGQGLRVTLPDGRGDTRPVSLEMSHHLRGDFDIVLGYELIKIGAPLPKYGAGVVIRVWFDSPSPLSVILSRFRKPSGEMFSAHKIVTGPQGKEQYRDNKDLKATRSMGKLRLVRTGPELQYLVAEEGQDFKVLQKVEIGTDDVLRLQVDCHTMYTPIALDVRLTELVLDADQFPNGIPLADTASPPAVAPPVERNGWLAAGGIIGLITTVSLVGAWLYARRGRRAMNAAPCAAGPDQQSQPKSAAPSLSLQCPSCRKKFKARPELAGKNLKCPQCGKDLVAVTRAGESIRPAL
jgi:serine/threonine protein kinase